MKKSSYFFILFIGFILTPNLNAQSSDFGNWFIYFGNQKINNKWNWHNEVQFRNYNFAGDLEQLLLRTGVGYNLTENNNNILVGYAYIYSEPYISGTDTKTNTTEHRIFQQFITRDKYGIIYIQHRYRFEQRFIEDDFKMRLRYFLSLNVPITKKEMVKNAVYASVYNEIFINTKPEYFDRDRIYGGIGYCINKNFKVETGVMTQILPNSNRTQFQIIFFNNLPF
jgi:Protein of unknown function (DUF2490)